MQTVDQTPRVKRGRIGTCTGPCGRSNIRIHSKKKCQSCYDATERSKNAKWRQIDLDPCPTCHLPTETHWICQACTGRGHLSPPSRINPTICVSCSDAQRKRIGFQRQAAADRERDRLRTLRRMAEVNPGMCCD